MKPRLILVFLAGWCLALAGCQKTDTGYTHTLKTTVEYYATGPQQGRPPDGQMAAGTKVRLVEAAGSYSLVEAATGKKGYVASDALQLNP